MVTVSEDNADSVDDLVDEIKNRLLQNADYLGDIETVNETNELPAILDTPCIYVVPFGSSDTIVKFTMGGDPFHNNVPITIAGFYTNDSVEEGLRLSRRYGYNVLSLFRGSNARILNWNAYNADMRTSYFEMSDNLIHTFLIRIEFKGYVVG